MENNKPPIRTISPGEYFVMRPYHLVRNIFHQVEGLYIDKDVSFADLKQTLLYFTKEMFENQNCLRPSYFLTEPSAEIDIWGLKPKQITESQKEPVG
jgi:phenylalanyl-tRNA synthetase alpha chain